jgi:HEPN domain-containing protein
MGLDFPRSHQLLFERREKGKIREVVKRLLESEFPRHFAYKENLPRVIFLTYFWGQFYTIAKYGIEELEVSPEKLFEKEDAELAVKHADLCVRVASNLLTQKNIEERKYLAGC